MSNVRNWLILSSFMVVLMVFWGGLTRLTHSGLSITDWLVLMICMQGFFGWYMVKSGLSDVPYVSHYKLALHLMTAL
ncbi:heme A synthase-like, partial [Symsagittifera roscoffensis]|uniref:heme A synthase-like n=1 Tax=Symsagittifera roscoffensis TaxID=84072 RepID=UPI00307B5D44